MKVKKERAKRIIPLMNLHKNKSEKCLKYQPRNKYFYIFTFLPFVAQLIDQPNIEKMLIYKRILQGKISHLS